MGNKKNRLSSKARAWLRFYFAEAEGNAAEAARLAGYGCPQSSGPRMAVKLRDIIEQKQLELDEQAMMTAKEVVKRLALEAETAELPRDRIRALEILAKIHGLEKTDIRIDRGELVRAVRENLQSVVGQIAPALPTPAKLLSH